MLNFNELNNTERIQSRSNPKVMLYASLSEKKHREETGLFLAEGIKLSEEALEFAETETLLINENTEKREEISHLIVKANNKNIPILLLSESAFTKISTEKSPQGVIAVVNVMKNIHKSDSFDEWQSGKRILMLDEIRDPGNLGTILRSSEALGISGVILSGTVDLYSPKTVRAAMGTLFRMSVYITDNSVECIKILQKNGRRVFATALGEHTLSLGSYETDPMDVIVIGNEGHGVTEPVLENVTGCVRIPMAGKTESLNASSAAACVLWEYFRSKNFD